MKIKIYIIILALFSSARVFAQHVIPQDTDIQGNLEVRKDQNALTAIRINNGSNSGSAYRGVLIGNGTSGNELQLLSTSENYTLFPAWKDAAVINAQGSLGSIIMRSASGRIRFQPNSLEDKIVFDENGNVGIGTSSPNANLEIYKYDGSSKLRLHTNQHAGTAVLEIAGGSALLDNITDNYSGWSIYHSYTHTKKDLYFRHGESGGPDVVFADNGFIGMGTTTPMSRLHVSSGISGDAVLTLEADTDNNYEGDNARIEMFQDGGGLGAFIGFNQAWGGSSNEPDNMFRIGTRYSEVNNYDRLVINTKNGNVGIGTDNPTTKLAVNGVIRSKELICEATNWPDYVFEIDYELKSLTELEQFIKTEGHLPNIPSAVEVEENGVTLGKMNALLLEKVEELTLYLLDQNTRIEKLESDNRHLLEQLNK